MTFWPSRARAARCRAGCWPCAPRRNGLEQSRFGFAVGKRVGKAVVRNKVKRRLRAAVGQLRPTGGWDVLITARAPAATVGYDELVRALADLFVRARIAKKADA